jgi:hypothetical protein
MRLTNGARGPVPLNQTKRLGITTS